MLAGEFMTYEERWIETVRVLLIINHMASDHISIENNINGIDRPCIFIPFSNSDIAMEYF